MGPQSRLCVCRLHWVGVLQCVDEFQFTIVRAAELCKSSGAKNTASKKAALLTNLRLDVGSWRTTKCFQARVERKCATTLCARACVGRTEKTTPAGGVSYRSASNVTCNPCAATAATLFTHNHRQTYTDCKIAHNRQTTPTTTGTTCLVGR